MEPQEPKRKKTRTRTGCQICRRRKVKCDEAPGGCDNCKRIGVVCPTALAADADAADPDGGGGIGGDGGSSLSNPSREPRRSRVYRSCQHCREARGKCSGDEPSCDRCRLRGLSCSYDGKQAPNWVEAVGDASQHRNPFRVSASRGERPGMDQGANFHLDSNEGSGDDADGADPASLLSHAMKTYYSEHTDSHRLDSIPRDKITGEALAWLLAPDLPKEEQRMIALLEEYFASVHGLRCLSFIHKSTFMEQLKERMRRPISEDVLLHTMCALGAKFYSLGHAHQEALEAGCALSVGSQWAKRARSLLFADLGITTIEKAMATVLLYEHALQAADFPAAFVLTGVALRMSQLLEINFEASTAPGGPVSPSARTTRESTRRLAWSIWAMQECTPDMTVLLPCDEKIFISQIPSYLEVPLGGPGAYDTRSESLCLQARAVMLCSLRKQVDKHILAFHEAPGARVSGPEFEMLKAGLERWHSHLPPSLHFSRETVSARKASRQLGGLVSLHVAYHQALCDLCCLCAHDYLGLEQVRDLCFRHAAATPAIVEEALRHGIEGLVEPLLPAALESSSRILAHYVRSAGAAFWSGYDGGDSRVAAAVAAIEINLRTLKAMIPMHTQARTLYGSIASLLALLHAQPEAPQLPGPPSRQELQLFMDGIRSAITSPLSALATRLTKEALRQTGAEHQGILTTSAYPIRGFGGQESLIPGEAIFQGLQPAPPRGTG